MKILIILSACLIATSLAQQGPRRQQQQSYQDGQPIEQQQQPQQQQPQQHAQYKEGTLRETSTYIPIVRFDKEQGADGSYKTAWETGNHIVAEETGFLKTVPPVGDSKEEGHAQVQHGSYSYTAPDGQIISVSYTADEHGFRATGDHIPTPPPVSPEVQKGLDLIYAGIKAQQEEIERNPEAAKNSALLNNAGLYRGE